VRRSLFGRIKAQQRRGYQRQGHVWTSFSFRLLLLQNARRASLFSDRATWLHGQRDISQCCEAHTPSFSMLLSPLKSLSRNLVIVSTIIFVTSHRSSKYCGSILIHSAVYYFCPKARESSGEPYWPRSLEGKTSFGQKVCQKAARTDLRAAALSWVSRNLRDADDERHEYMPCVFPIQCATLQNES